MTAVDTLETRDSPPALAQYPVELYLEVTNRCNLKCRTCPQYFGMPEAFFDMSMDQVRQITDQMPRIDRVVMHGIGESLLNPILPDAVAHLKGRGSYVLMNSNGTTLKPRRSEAVIRAGIDEIRISIDAATSETYRHVRGSKSFDQILRNIEWVTQIKLQLGMRTPRLSLWMTGLRSTIAELPRLVRLAARIGIDDVHVQRLVTSERGLARDEESLYGVSGSSLGPVLDAEAVAKQLGIRLHGSGNLGARASLRPADERASWRGCRRPWTLMYITANGNVLPCCISPFTGTPYDSLIVGNVFRDRLADIWRGARYRAWRAAMWSDTPPEACRGCGLRWSL